MITFEEAYKSVMKHAKDFGTEMVSLSDSVDRVLAEDVSADRDFPPFNRSTKDGISLNFEGIEKGLNSFKNIGVIAAGTAQQVLTSSDSCMEIMTGAVLPKGADTVVMYEDITIANGQAVISKVPQKGQNIHQKGYDKKEGTLVLIKNSRITPAEIGVLASVGKTHVKVKKLPLVCVVSTGNELVDIAEKPLPHQIRKSNTLSLDAALRYEGIRPVHHHLSDDKEKILKELKGILNDHDVVLMSGGVSKGKFDFIPESLALLGVDTIFHGVWQRPGKPFLFGINASTKTTIFSFPGNPVSTFVNYLVYFRDWLHLSWGLDVKRHHAQLKEAIEITNPFTRLIKVTANFENGILKAKIIGGGGSGNLTSLVVTDGFVVLQPGSYQIGAAVPFIPSRAII